MRLALNDAAGSALLVGINQDLEHGGNILSIEASRRIGNNWLLSIVSRAFIDLPPNDPLFSMRNDDYIELNLAYYF